MEDDGFGLSAFGDKREKKDLRRGVGTAQYLRSGSERSD